MMMIDDLQRTLYRVFILSNYCRLSLPAAQGGCACGLSGERVCWYDKRACRKWKPTVV